MYCLLMRQNHCLTPVLSKYYYFLMTDCVVGEESIEDFPHFPKFVKITV